MSDIKNVFDIAGRSMAAQMVRLNTVASNIANAEARAGSAEDAYRPLRPVFQTVFEDGMRNAERASVEVRDVIALDREPLRVHEPGHPLADEEGYVYIAPVDVNEEMVDMIEASRQYQNNLEVVTTMRTLMMRTVNMGKS
ncbi:MAG: flagellar basal body rod protein FlgC [Planktotalea sp.]|jgi:flagellar basal-body rod protein FlgC|uniref:flagellar basal body rod protein FlgC n=1 Tax=Planktotalea sp. TaxID=2029877 RepID=UPI000183A6AA|nr:flagellar basal body rod protein FlgC [Planktotalea sp.]EDZ44078.1 flagellar basal-body rod protein FlgC [Rhodobacteraceae bacterium HTCC2083]MDG1075069.1 flagellar basal body rod protein FlgC [Planktotalea sp.]MDG1085569.1 flagellar basal body rod protein FlgC [Planktotalea sp.]HCW83544.1 flagellar basal body rod protein FlgC [Paracoccaceae bacterium]